VALAIYRTAKPENRKAVGGALFSVAFTAFLTGITEPIEFMFMFLAPVLYALHAVLTGLALAVSYTFGILHGFGFSAGFIDYALNWGLATKPVMIIPIGLVFGFVYYIIFVWVIQKLDIPTPGRVDEEMDESAMGSLNISEFSAKLVERLGGKANIDALDACITRLRMTVKDPDAIDEAALKSMGIKGLLKKANNIQVIVGTRAELIADEMKKSINM